MSRSKERFWIWSWLQKIAKKTLKKAPYGPELKTKRYCFNSRAVLKEHTSKTKIDSQYDYVVIKFLNLNSNTKICRTKVFELDLEHKNSQAGLKTDKQALNGAEFIFNWSSHTATLILTYRAKFEPYQLKKVTMMIWNNFVAKLSLT